MLLVNQGTTVGLIRLSDSSIVKGTLINEAEVYNLGVIVPGNYLVKATSVGYKQAISESFTVSESKANITMPIIVMYAANNSLNTVVITESKPLIEMRFTS